MMQFKVDTRLLFQSKGDTLIQAVCVGDVEKVERLLDAKFNKVDVNYVSKEGFTALHHAVASCRDKVTAGILVSKLLQAGADPNSSSQNKKARMIGWTPLHIAAEYVRIEIMRILMQARANTSLTTQDDRTVASIILSSQRASAQDRFQMLEIIGATHLMPDRMQVPRSATEPLQHSPLLARGLPVAYTSQQTNAPQVQHSGPLQSSAGTPYPPGEYASQGPPAAYTSQQTSAPQVQHSGPLQSSTEAPFPLGDASQQREPVLKHEAEPDDMNMYIGGESLKVDQPVGAQVLDVNRSTFALTSQLVATVTAGIIMVNPAALVQVTLVLLMHVMQSMAAAAVFKHRSARIAERCQAVEPSLVVLNGIVMRRDSGLTKQQARAIVVAVSLVGRVICQFKTMMDMADVTKSKSSRAAMVTQMLIKAQPQREQLTMLEQDLRHSINCLNLVLNATQISQNAATARALQHLADLKPVQWNQQNEEDRKKDMAEMQDNILKLFDSVEDLKAQLEEHSKQAKEAHAVGLQDVSEWLAQMGADNSRIAAHLEEKIDGLAVRVSGVQASLDSIMSTMLQQFRGTQIQGRDKLLIPRSSIEVPDGALDSCMSGSYGKVLRALRDGGPVALKVYNYKLQLPGARDCEEAFREALMLSYACHHNVVRCYGIVHDPDESNKQGSIHGSLVMEWVGGGTLNEWMQENWRSSIAVRVQLACQVAAGMLHLHQQGLIHGDLKPQNVLMTEQLPSQAFPEAKICDFGLSKLVSSTMRSTTLRQPTASCTTGYTSPERLKSYKRSQQDDVFAFGIVMYFMAESRSPFSDIPEQYLKQAIIDGHRPPIDEWMESCGSADAVTQKVVARYCALAKQCWSPEASNRPGFREVYTAMREMVKQLLAATK